VAGGDAVAGDTVTGGAVVAGDVHPTAAASTAAAPATAGRRHRAARLPPGATTPERAAAALHHPPILNPPPLNQTSGSRAARPWSLLEGEPVLRDLMPDTCQREIRGRLANELLKLPSFPPNGTPFAVDSDVMVPRRPSVTLAGLPASRIAVIPADRAFARLARAAAESTATGSPSSPTATLR